MKKLALVLAAVLVIVLGVVGGLLVHDRIVRAEATAAAPDACEEAARAYADEQQRLGIWGFSKTQISYPSASDLLAANGLNSEEVFRAQAREMPAVPRVSIGPIKLFKVAATAKDAARMDNQINASINCTRVINPAKAQELAAEFVRISALFVKEAAGAK